jgi:glyoxylase-like metal-dependent hydrolase (beta-lactamase superfamily II)
MTAQPAATHSVQLGDGIVVTFVADGSIHVPHNIFLGQGGSPELWTDHPEYLDADGLLLMSLGAILVEVSGTRVLIDLGVGPVNIDLEPLVGAPGSMIGGSLISELNKLAIDVDDIDAVLLSHLHADHVGWLITDTASGPELTFGRAAHFVAKAEHQFWEDPANAGRAGGPSPVQRATLNEARLTYLEDRPSPVPAITSMFTPGHTPGHCSFVIESSAARAIVLGDCMHCPVEISHPHLAGQSDVDIELGKASRARLHCELDRPNTICIAPHFPDYVFGHVVTTRNTRQFVPLD